MEKESIHCVDSILWHFKNYQMHIMWIEIFSCRIYSSIQILWCFRIELEHLIPMRVRIWKGSKSFDWILAYVCVPLHFIHLSGLSPHISLPISKLLSVLRNCGRNFNSLNYHMKGRFILNDKILKMRERKKEKNEGGIHFGIIVSMRWRCQCHYAFYSVEVIRSE